MTKICPFMRIAFTENNYIAWCVKNDVPSLERWKPCSLFEYLEDTPVGNDYLTRKDVEAKCPKHFKCEQIIEKTECLLKAVAGNLQKEEYSIRSWVEAKENHVYQFVAYYTG